MTSLRTSGWEARGFSAVQVFLGVPGCSGVFRCSGVPVFQGVPVFLILVHAINKCRKLHGYRGQSFCLSA